MEDLKRARSHAKGQVTRVTQTLTKMQLGRVQDYDLDLVQRYEGHLQHAEDTFDKAHQAMFERDETMSEDQHFDEKERHLALVAAARRIAFLIRTCVKTQSLARRVTMAMEDLQAELVDGYTPSFAKQYQSIEAQMQTFR